MKRYLLLIGILVFAIGCAKETAEQPNIQATIDASVETKLQQERLKATPSPTMDMPSSSNTPVASYSLETPTAIPTQTAKTSPTPLPQQAKSTPSEISSSTPEIVYKFKGEKSGETDHFDVGNSSKILINYKGGPITVYWVEEDGQLRQIYNGPASRNGKYDTDITESGRNSVRIKCDEQCEWAITIETISAKSTTSSPIVSASKKNNNDQSDTETKVQTSEIVLEEWDVFAQIDASIILSAPNTEAITVEYDSATRMAKITGNKASVPAKSHVMVANLELGNFLVIGADKDGKFQVDIDAHPGTHILIKQDITGKVFNVENPEATHGPNTLRTIFPPGVLIRIPVPNLDNGITFSSAGRLPSDEDAPWTISGNLSKTQLSPGQQIEISGQVAIRTGNNNQPSTGQLSFEAYLLINANGRQVGGASNFTTSLFTATELPIEHKGLSKQSLSFDASELDWRFENKHWVSDFTTSLTFKKDTQIGLYELQAKLSGVKSLPRIGDQNILHRSFLQNASIGTLMVGSSQNSMRLTPTLLADVLSEGSRGGVVAREDQGYFDISHRSGIHHQPVIPRLDSYGRFWKYGLEPFVPMLGVVDRSPPDAPSINLDFSNSTLTITVLKPDGQMDVMGPASLTRYTLKSPRTPWHTTVSEGGGNLGEIPQLQSSGNQFDYEFPTDGNYVVTLNGEINDLTGRNYIITGTYDVTVANILDIETSILPGTPFEVGNSLPIGLRVMPGLPATITYKVTHTEPSGETITRNFNGKANENGWWDGNGESFKFQTDGEYRIDVEARYSDTANNLWVGRLTFGSVIATPDAPIILHGRRGPNGVSQIQAAWGSTENFTDPNADHMQFPYFSGDILWSQNSGHLKGSVATLTSIQMVDENHTLVSRIKEQASSGGSGIPIGDSIKTGQLPFETSIKPGVVSRNDEIDLWKYSYASVQRPGVRVREHILGNDLGGTYWRFDDAYHMQSGNGRQGDLPGDFKFMYAGAVIRDSKADQGIYANYGSGWVMTQDNDPMGARLMPPFQGAAGGPDGGPLLKIHGRPIDIFFLPLGVRPGAVFETGESFRMAGPIMPTLPSYVEYTVTAPDGNLRKFEGRANNVGYFYQPEDDFSLNQAGIWSVELKVTHDGMTSAGPVAKPYPTGGPLTVDGSTFVFIVKGLETRDLLIETNLSQLTPQEWFSNVRTANFEASLPDGSVDNNARVVVTMPGIVLVDEEVTTTEGTMKWLLNSEKLNQLANNFDYEQGIADTITVTFYVSGKINGKPVQSVGTIITHGARVPIVPKFVTTLDELPELSSFETIKTNKFMVDFEHMKGGHPFKGSGTKDPDNGAHVNFDNSTNQWPEGTLVSDYPPIYAISDGYVSRISTWEPVGEKNYMYVIWLVFAQKDGTPVRFLMSIEPSTNPGDSSFYEPFIIVKEGQSVRKGDIVAYMYLEPNDGYPGPHIHFSIAPEREEQQAPAIFTEKIVNAFHAKWGIFRFDSKDSRDEEDIEMPACMGYKLTADENPFSTTAVECLK